MWFLMLKSGVHATIAGVALAFAIPFSAKDTTRVTLTQARTVLHKPVAFTFCRFLHWQYGRRVGVGLDSKRDQHEQHRHHRRF